MRPAALPLPSRRRLGLPWLIWLALLLPLAQTAASWHLFSHVAQRTSQRTNERDDAGLAHAPCVLCVTAAAVDHGGLPVAAIAAPSPEPLPQAAEVQHRASWQAAPTLGYASRAPPSLLR